MWRPDCAAVGQTPGCRAGTAPNRRLSLRRLSVLLACSLVGLLWHALPASGSDPSELELRLQQLRADIAQIQSRLDADLASRDELQLELARAERQVAEIDRTLRATGALVAENQERIGAIEQRMDDIAAQMAETSAELGAQLRLAHQQGGHSRLKLLLNQENPRELARQMAYHGYLSRARLALLAELERLHERMRDSRVELGRELAQLGELQARQRDELGVLQAARQERDQALHRLQARIESQEDQLVVMQRDAAELQDLIEELARALRDIPMDIEVPSILGLQGQLPAPVQGPLRRRFGDARGGELRWNGWLIGAAQGAAVRAIAHGRVAYADWLRGYGMLLIIDHGDGVMSLYGNNESLLHQVGAWVAAGDEIATAGGGEPGLYFELRRDGQPVNPAAWLMRP